MYVRNEPCSVSLNTTNDHSNNSSGQSTSSINSINNINNKITPYQHQHHYHYTDMDTDSNTDTDTDIDTDTDGLTYVPYHRCLEVLEQPKDDSRHLLNLVAVHEGLSQRLGNRVDLVCDFNQLAACFMFVCAAS